jgi:hypothetical protein
LGQNRSAADSCLDAGDTVAISDQRPELPQIHFRLKSLYIVMIYGAPDRIKLRTPILLRFQYDYAAAGQWQTTGA